MRIQTKLFVLLLVIALIPLVALSWRSERALQGLGGAIVASGKTAVIEEIEAQLLQAVGYSSDLIEAQRHQVELALRLMAGNVERRLAGPAPSADAELYMHTDFNSPQSWPPGTDLALDHAVSTAGRELQAVPISRLHQSFFLPAGVDVEAVRPLMHRLSQLDGFYRQLDADNAGLFYWQYVALKEGVHAVFPGHGGYPETYDPRNRAWYQSAAAANDLIWTPPVVDASTRRLLLTAAMPVHDRDGAFAGVAGIDIDVLRIMSAVQTRVRVGANAETYIVQVTDRAGTPLVQGRDAADAVMRVIASNRYRDTGASWDADPELPVLEADQSVRTEMTADLMAGRGGIMRALYKERESLWVYGALERLGATLVYVVPVDDIEGVADRAQESVRQAVLDQVRLAGIATVAMVVLTAGLAMLASRSITGPLRALAATAQGLARGNLDARAEVSSRDEVGDLATIFNAMVPELRNHIQVKESLGLAREVQQKLLPAAAPHVEGFDIAGRSMYHDAVGGDYYDFIPLRVEDGSERIGIVVGDVSGHGIVAALTMTSVRALLRSFAEDDTALQPVMRAVNRHVAADAAAGRFVTLVYLVLDPLTRKLRWISAGHGPLLFFDRATREFEELPAHDIPLGVNPDWAFQENERDTWPSSGLLVIGTDGVWETRNPEGEAFGREGLMDVIRETSHLSASEICDAVASRLAAFAGGGAQNDDVTLVIVKFLPREKASGGAAV